MRAMMVETVMIMIVRQRIHTIEYKNVETVVAAKEANVTFYILCSVQTHVQLKMHAKFGIAINGIQKDVPRIVPSVRVVTTLCVNVCIHPTGNRAQTVWSVVTSIVN
jgi:hypothetical protein